MAHNKGTIYIMYTGLKHSHGTKAFLPMKSGLK